nr:hypothetical protein [Ferrimicrobium acidiphilum]
MGKRQSDVTRLDRAITTLEHLILAASDREILAKCATEAHDIRRIIDKSIAKCDMSTARGGAAERRFRPKAKKRHSQMLGDWQAKVAFFRNLIATRPDLSPRLRSVFSTGQMPTSEELDDLTDELISLGLISENGPKKK